MCIPSGIYVPTYIMYIYMCICDPLFLPSRSPYMGCPLFPHLHITFVLSPPPQGTLAQHCCATALASASTSPTMEGSPGSRSSVTTGSSSLPPLALSLSSCQSGRTPSLSGGPRKLGEPHPLLARARVAFVRRVSWYVVTASDLLYSWSCDEGASWNQSTFTNLTDFRVIGMRTERGEKARHVT